MSENKDYISRLNKARRNRNQKWDPRYILMALAAVVLIGIIVLAVINVKSAVSGRVARGGSENLGKMYLRRQRIWKRRQTI